MAKHLIGQYKLNRGGTDCLTHCLRFLTLYGALASPSHTWRAVRRPKPSQVGLGLQQATNSVSKSNTLLAGLLGTRSTDPR